MGWSGPGRKRHRAVRMRVEHACDGGTSLPGWLEDACAFGRSARLRVGSARFSGHGGPGCRAVGRAAALADQAARRGWRHGSAPYASIADDSEVDCDRPIKCCDDIHSISHYRPAPAMCGRDARRGCADYQGNPDGCDVRAMRPHTATRRARRRSRCIALRGSSEGGRYVRGSGVLRQRSQETVRSDRSEPTCRRTSRCDSAAPVRAHSDAATDVVEKRRKRREKNCRPVDRASGSG